MKAATPAEGAESLSTLKDGYILHLRTSFFVESSVVMVKNLVSLNIYFIFIF